MTEIQPSYNQRDFHGKMIVSRIP